MLHRLNNRASSVASLAAVLLAATLSVISPSFNAPVQAAPPALRTAGQTAPVPQGQWMVVTADNVYLRSAPSVESSYPYAAFSRGTVVRVVEESFGWGRIAAVGPAFRDRFGYVKSDRRVRLGDDGRTAEITARTDVLAPNLAARNSPDSSWKAIARLDPGTRVTVLGTVEGQRDTVLSIPLPADAEGWINMSFLRMATADEIRAVDPTAARTADRETARPTPPAPAEPRREATPRPGTTGTEPPPTDAPRQAPTGTPARTPVGETDDDGEVDETETDDSAEATDATAPVRPVVPPPPPPPPPQPRIQLADLERAFDRLTREDPATAEVTTLRQRYLAFVDEPGVSDGEREFARGRAEQLAMRERVQERLQEARRIRARSEVDLETIRSTRVAMDARREYIAVGRLNASSVYDGVRLPLLFRLQDPSGGQTIGYLQPGRDGRDFDLGSLLGQLVGIVGSRTYDEALRVNIVVPTRIDVLTGVR